MLKVPNIAHFFVYYLVLSFIMLTFATSNKKLNNLDHRRQRISGTKFMTTNTICKGYTRDGRRVKVEERYDSIAVCLGIFVIIEDGYEIDEIEKPGRDSAISLFKWFVTK